MKIITRYPVIRINSTSNEVLSNGVDTVSNVRGGGGGGHRGGGGGRGGHGGGGGFGGRRGGRRPVVVGGGGFYWNGAYWVDVNGLCYEKNWLGQYTLVDCGVVPAVAFGL